ncbi:uncharacterized protein PHACADRAFT_123371 [Phanerochaete carnosa HHB-10118-sp]|uniref:Peptidase C15, pyroglutamyl peptidase I-like protein n=1 Tax=Phanerochaete carnosa (strain HHB-10118-sp) TaxID=650164 RepID=K5W600_PHACS|nr:uncharacterized protein PHACADRAFT_123371 [Phanerochaete carnosa HHB-10118-sp]EKM54374.1 hypothetical protein PHACADRAFT_123371 [Phanerochaete carnosa HHB-10118-sp]
MSAEAAPAPRLTSTLASQVTPTPHYTVDVPDPNAIHILITGFGPFWRYNENPSWLAVKPLHNTMLEDTTPRIQQIYITVLQIPMVYQNVLQFASGLHAKPPVLPPPIDPTFAPVYLPPNGFDFIFHIGVAGRGPLRLEKLAHKLGYRMKDAEGQLAPIVHVPKDPVRGFGKTYESMPDELYTEIDVPRLILHLKEQGIQKAYSSMDAGHYLCDFLFYASLAEAKRNAAKQEKDKMRSTPPKMTPVLFMHCCPIGQPHTTDEITDAIKKVVLWVCARLSI